MELRSFFWDAAARHRGTRRRDVPAGAMRVGNAGDLFNIDLARFLYGAEFTNIEDSGPRLLLVGSVAHRILRGDLVCGVGTKGTPIPPPEVAPVTLTAVRGPITREAYRDAGHDVSGIRFEGDPGLLIGVVYADRLRRVRARRGRQIFIPHYRERARFASTRQLAVIDVDCTAERLATEILRAEHVYASSLHGLIFAHALGRAATLVAPVTAEPEIKYRDYFASIGLGWTTPADLDTAVRSPKPDSALSLPLAPADFAFPTAQELRERGILTG